MPRVSTVEALIFVAGIIAALVAGVSAYHAVGPYGDGAFGGNFFREEDPRTGDKILFHESVTSRGVVRHIFDEKYRLRQIWVDPEQDRTFDIRFKVEGTERILPIDSNKDDTTDRWEHFDASGMLIKTGESSRGDGVEDTWTYLDKDGLLSRIESDQNRDGVIDKRQVFGPSADGSRRVLRVVEMNLDKSGLPRMRLSYRPDGSFEKSEVLRPK